MPNDTTWLKIREISEGFHFGERIISIQQADGTDVETIAGSRSINNSSIDIGYPVANREDGAVLVELPHETCHGAWRVWVNPAQLTSGAIT